MKLYWISWYQPGDDIRPLNFPPNEAILGWWKTGETWETGVPQRGVDHTSTLCAYVEAESAEKAKEAVRVDWPEAGDWRFVEEREYITSCDRFGQSDWMKPRMGRWSQPSRIHT